MPAPTTAFEVVVRELTPELIADFEAVFRSEEGCEGCWCLNHHLASDEPDRRGEAARLGKAERVRAGTSRGLLAYLEGEPVGWAAIDRPRHLPGHDCAPTEGPGAWALHCIYLKPEARGRGVLRRLLAEAEVAVRRWGGTTLEAYSLPEGDNGYDFLPPRRPFEARGYQSRQSPDPAYGVWIKNL